MFQKSFVKTLSKVSQRGIHIGVNNGVRSLVDLLFSFAVISNIRLVVSHVNTCLQHHRRITIAEDTGTGKHQRAQLD